MTIARVTTFNVNQFSPVKHQQADLAARMALSDVVLCQETVDIDLDEFAATVPGWGGFQIRNGENDGHANTGVLYRLARGPITATDCTFLVNTKGERRRFLTGVQQGGVWYWSAHINPARFRTGIPDQLAHIGLWVDGHRGPMVGGLDRNQCPPGALERATSLTWQGKGIDGFLSNLPMANLAEFPKGFSDHPGVHADVSLPATQEGGKPVTAPETKGLARIRALLRAAIAWATAHGKTGRARREKAALDALKKPKAKPKPPKPPRPDPTPRGFMPGAILEPIPAGANDPPIVPCGVIQHIAVSSSDDIRPIFTDGRGIESHFYIRKDGTILQYRSIFFEADANADGNSFGSPRRGFVSVEHQGGVGADLAQPMPKAQLDAFHEVILWVKSQADFPLRVTPAWNQPGVGYHAMFKEWNPNAHSCPGAARIKQFNEATVPWLKSGGKS